MGKDVDPPTSPLRDVSAGGTEADLEPLLDYLERTRAVDLSGYTRPMLAAMIGERMDAVGAGSLSEYQDVLEVDPDEIARLFHAILVDPASLFQDRAVWSYLGAELIPSIVGGKDPEAPIRVWSAACATGEEPYSLAMLFSEALGPEAFRRRVKIYGTDVDVDALARARNGFFPPEQAAEIPEDLRERYFERVGDGYLFRQDLRRSIVFGRLDLVEDAPISRIDLLVCRNVLTYLTPEAQSRVLRHIHFALNDGGYCFLGKADTIVTGAELFAPVDAAHRIFLKVADAASSVDAVAWSRDDEEEAAGAGSTLRLRELAFDNSPNPELVVDALGVVAFVNEWARRVLGLTQADVGRPFYDLEISYRPVELRARIEEAHDSFRPVLLRQVQGVGSSGSTQRFDIEIKPMIDARGRFLGSTVVFIDVTDTFGLQAALERSRHDLQAAYEELQATNEELETSNEELQATLEEVETTNEELQSSNQELETLNEQLESSNTGLRASTEQTRERIEDVAHENVLLESILASLRAAVVCLDTELRVTVWNGRAEDMWGMRREEVIGKAFQSLDIGLPIDPLRKPIRMCLSGEASFQEANVEAVTRRGSKVGCHVGCSRLEDPRGRATGVVLVIEQL